MTYSSGGFDWSSLSRQLTFHLSFSRHSSLSLSFSVGLIFDLPIPLALFFNPIPFSFHSGVLQLIGCDRLYPFGFHLAQSGCMRVRVLTLCELVMRDGSVVTIIYYGSGGKWRCDDFSPVATHPPVKVLIIHSLHCRTILGSRIALLSLRSYDSVEVKKCLNVISLQLQFFLLCSDTVLPTAAQTKNAEVQWLQLQMDSLNSLNIFFCSLYMIILTFHTAAT